MEIVSLFFLITGFLVFGEALALYIGVFLVKKGQMPWNHSVNKLFLISDLLGGSVLLINYFSISGLLWQVFLGLIIFLMIISHFLRIFEFLSKKENAFCGNKPLFIVNNLKLVLLFGLIFTLLPW